MAKERKLIIKSIEMIRLMCQYFVAAVIMKMGETLSSIKTICCLERKDACYISFISQNKSQH